jgi:predicted RecB family nuclease
VLSAALRRDIALGKIVHGDDHAILKVKTLDLAGEVRKRLEQIVELLASPTPPDLILNRHCAECEFKECCRQKAIEKDDLSLLAGMSEKARTRHRGKGIFTVNQLSYTFSPRRTPKGAKNPAKPHYLALQALAIREKTVYVHGNPHLPDSKSQVYLDIEGLPDTEFYYLIGALVVSDGQDTFHAFWADKRSDEPTIFAKFAETVCQLPDFRILHYGDYETVALRRMRAKSPTYLHPQIDTILERATNVLSLVHSHVYFPTYSNGLKDSGPSLGCERTHENATGLLTIVWRKCWEATGNPNRKVSLLQYNEEDCRALKHVSELIARLTHPETVKPASSEALPMTVHTDALLKERPHWELFRPRDYTSEDFKHIIKCAYFHYQREKVFVRTHRHFRIINKRHRKRIQTTTHPTRS